MRVKGLIRFGAMILLLLAVAGCEEKARQSQEPEQVLSSLEARAAERWDALIRGDFNAAYLYASPAYRALYTPQQFSSRFGRQVLWERVDVGPIEPLSEDAARVGITIHFSYHQVESGQTLEASTFVRESWILADGDWWYVPGDRG
ncbi:hypothetical protein BDD21_1825 [Thiocapsa rosea]|uniref:DUF4440 domain-containing protein n=2 Tax=Thiocapsa rosea TaxID=69360 RepID=A0A495V746_9GAMM|nr:hypothetical protein BDD21_1825 [Thiocapsa rosea]